MTEKTIIIDCDPGVDDAVALLLALASPDLEILAITTVGGNVSAALTARNARIIRQIAERPDVPIHAGAGRPLARSPVEAGHFHGESGLGSLPLFEPEGAVATETSADLIVDAVMARPPGSVTLAVLGPMTNLALAIIRQPEVAKRLAGVVVMGGARTAGGNITASAEYNIHADPHAAHLVLSSVPTTVMLGLDATHQVRCTDARIEAIAALANPMAEACAALMRFSNSIERDLVGGRASPLHDPCVIAFILRPDLFTGRPARIDVETNSPLTLGHTAVEFRLPDPGRANGLWIVEVDADGVFDLLTRRLAAR